MRRGLVHAAAWALATGVAVTLSWFGVHSVLAGTAYDPPRALAVSDNVAGHSPDGSSAQPLASSTHRPIPKPSASSPDGGTTSEPPRRPPGTSRDTATSGSGTGNVHSYALTGGRVALDLGPSSATLVSATPDAGWEMKIWKQPEWLRIDFTSGTTTSSIFCTWNGHPPSVEYYRN